MVRVPQEALVAAAAAAAAVSDRSGRRIRCTRSHIAAGEQRTCSRPRTRNRSCSPGTCSRTTATRAGSRTDARREPAAWSSMSRGHRSRRWTTSNPQRTSRPTGRSSRLAGSARTKRTSRSRATASRTWRRWESSCTARKRYQRLARTSRAGAASRLPTLSLRRRRASR